MSIESELKLFAETQSGGAEITAEILEKFALFYKELIEFNRKVNLTSVTDESEFVVKHIADSLSAEKYLPYGAAVCDIGPGGGFPSIPLKILRNDLKFSLFEATEKKSAFINAAAKTLNLNDFICFHKRAEDAARTPHRESFDAVAARAVAPLNVLLEYALPLVKKGGIFIAYKGEGEDPSAGNRAAKLLGSKPPAIHEITLPRSEYKRRLLIYEKINAAPAIYPRSGNKPRLDPL
ncbi:MAG: 16S rRNA (guanine(527)-N(7))-methyltransferase RsmG [Clostridiales bacterium]|jgi:16S rRNA (guanine527-N7)-methyltransferase|nr:16S rRNA (guanine(527)-N(7))-methyltransferase RsmG [Clostridiales bacterium]